MLVIYAKMEPCAGFSHHSCRWALGLTLSSITATVAAVSIHVPLALADPSGPPARLGGTAPQRPRDGWKDCTFNDMPAACLDERLPRGMQVTWKDGRRMKFQEEGSPGSGENPYLRDQRGGLWQREILAQGNTILTNTSNGTRIFIPLRFPCKPPLKGEVGYCRY